MPDSVQSSASAGSIFDGQGPGSFNGGQSIEPFSGNESVDTFNGTQSIDPFISSQSTEPLGDSRFTNPFTGSATSNPYSNDFSASPSSAQSVSIENTLNQPFQPSYAGYSSGNQSDFSFDPTANQSIAQSYVPDEKWIPADDVKDYSQYASDSTQFSGKDFEAQAPEDTTQVPQQQPEKTIFSSPEFSSQDSNFSRSDGGPSAVPVSSGSDVFLFGGIEKFTPGIVRIGGETLDVIGYSSQSGGYFGNIQAGGLEVGGEANYIGAVTGNESSISSGGSFGLQNTGINIEYGAVGAELPLIGGASIGYGEYSTAVGETGSFVFGSAHILGIGLEFGLGWSGEGLEPNAY